MKNLLIAVLVGLAALIGLAVLLSMVLTLSPSLGVFSNKIAVIPVKGAIEADKSQFVEELSAGEIVERLEDARDDPSIAAVLLDIDSGGGSAVATKQIVAAVQGVRQEKPVVAWIGDLGASAAYYIAASADYVVADEDSITGSIGAISVMPNLKDLLEEWGVRVNILRAGEYKGMGNMFEDLNAGQRELLQAIVQDAAEHFKRDVRLFRGEKLDPARFEASADGRLLNGGQALEIGLLDELGTKQDAVSKAAGLAGVEQPVTIDFGHKEISFFDLFGGAGYSFGFGFRQGLFSASQPKIE